MKLPKIRTRVTGYNKDDINMYFARSGSILHFKDKNGRKRIARVVEYDNEFISYQVALLSLTGFADKIWRKRPEDFERFVYRPKYIQVDEYVFYVFPSGERTIQKGLTQRTHRAINLNTGVQESMSHPELYWEYLWGEEFSPVSKAITVNGNKYLYGVKL